MKTHYSSQTGDRRFFWMKNTLSNQWMLGQTKLLRSGKLAATWSERCVFREPEGISEPDLLALFVQAENDVTFNDAAGIKGEPQKSKITDYFKPL